MTFKRAVGTFRNDDSEFFNIRETQSFTEFIGVQDNCFPANAKVSALYRHVDLMLLIVGLKKNFWIFY